MYLTQMPLNPVRHGTRRLVSSPHAMHAAVLAGFPPDDGRPGDEGRVLWRLDTPARHKVRLLVLSPRKPDLTHLVEQAGWPTASAWQTREYAPLLERLVPGQRWAYRIVANPVRAQRSPDGRRSRRLAHVTVAQQVGWWLDRLPRCGAAPLVTAAHDPDVVVSDRRTRRFNRDQAGVTLATARFDGNLVVEDADLLRSAMMRGIGPAKGYGCGLLTLAPAG